ncbi:unnamed protein product [Prunus armeniaca]
MDSNWGSSSNSELEDQWEERRRQLTEKNEEDDTQRSKNDLMAATTASWVCEEISQQPLWVYIEDDFKSRFRMRRHVFEHLLHDVQAVNPFFHQRVNNASQPSFSPHQRVTIALRMMACAYLADAMSDTFGMSESSSFENLAQFCRTIVHIYKDTYLRAPNAEDMDHLL